MPALTQLLRGRVRSQTPAVNTRAYSLDTLLSCLQETPFLPFSKHSPPSPRGQSVRSGLLGGRDWVTGSGARAQVLDSRSSRDIDTQVALGSRGSAQWGAAAQSSSSAPHLSPSYRPAGEQAEKESCSPECPHRPLSWQWQELVAGGLRGSNLPGCPLTPGPCPEGELDPPPFQPPGVSSINYSVPSTTGAPPPNKDLEASGAPRGFSFPEPQSLTGGASTPPPAVARICLLHLVLHVAHLLWADTGHPAPQ